MENLIVIEGNDKRQFKDFESLIENLICKNYFALSKEEREKELEKKTIANTMLKNIKIVKWEYKSKEYNTNDFVLYDEITYILSLLNIGKIILLERTDANIFGKYIDKEKFEDNYIIVNKFADEIMRKYSENK